MKSIDPVLVGFILFCVERKGTHWPALYDEMCRVAGGHMYQGLGYTELKEKGFSLGLSDIEETIKKVETILASQVSSVSITPLVSLPPLASTTSTP